MSEIDFQIGVERECKPIFLEDTRESIGYEDTIPYYYLKVYGIKIYISEIDYKNIVMEMNKNE